MHPLGLVTSNLRMRFGTHLNPTRRARGCAMPCCKVHCMWVDGFLLVRTGWWDVLLQSTDDRIKCRLNNLQVIE